MSGPSVASPIAQAALLASIPATIALFAALPKAPERAGAIALVGGILFLPERVAINVPYLDLDKSTIPALVALMMSWRERQSGPEGKARSAIFSYLVAFFLLSRVGIVLTNRHPIPIAPGVQLEGLNLTNIITQIANIAVTTLVPFAVGRRLFRTTERLTLLLRVISVGAFGYTFLMIIELIVSPQLHSWVYGYHQHSFGQAVRSGGYRPMAFMAHGLAATMFLVIGIMASLTLKKANSKEGPFSPGKRAAFTIFILTLCNSFGSLIYGLFMTPVLLAGSPRLIGRITRIASLLIFVFPLLRAMQWIPLDDVIAFMADINPDRAGSLAFRFQNEEALLDKWSAQPWFGYGNGRNAVYNDEGRSITTFDGAWIIILSAQGLMGFLCFFSLLLTPVWMSQRYISGRNLSTQDRALLSGLSLIVLVSTFELLINGLFNSLPMILAGALYGFNEGLTGTIQGSRRLENSFPSL